MPVPQTPVVSFTDQGARHIEVSWSQEFKLYVNNYTIQYNASVNQCSDTSNITNITTTTRESLNITGLEEDSTIWVAVIAINIGGSAPAAIDTAMTLKSRKHLPKLSKFAIAILVFHRS